MALPVQQNALPGTPGFPAQRDVLVAAQRAHTVKHRAEKEASRRPATTRRQSLRRVNDSREELRRIRTAGTSSGTVDSSTTTTTTSATAPSGRSFTVANINNGIIYLRPVVRAGNQRNRPQPDPFVFPPQTPPDSAKLDSKAVPPPSDDWDKSLLGSPKTTRHETAPLPLKKPADDDIKRPALFAVASPPLPSAHLRSRSLSTADEHSTASHHVEPGTFKVVIERPPHKRPKTADTGSLPVLEVPIPHYRLGTPRFSARGTAILRSSIHTGASGTDDVRSSFLTPPRAVHSFFSSRHRSEVYTPVSLNYPITLDSHAMQANSAPSSARVSKVPIGPQLYDALTANPDDSAVVRFSSSGDILAATPSRLVAHITSPSFLDYELLSDFFLTFRSFLSPRDLAAYLISRLRWAVDRQDDFGRIVRVRTFVALRHWILNYFVDDFVPYYPLRLYFCELVNDLFRDLKSRSDGGGGDVKIVGELKKCWRRTCALYWDAEDGAWGDLADVDLLPGGHAGSQVSTEEDHPSKHAIAPATPTRPPNRAETTSSNPSDQFASKYMDWAQRARHTPQNSLSSPYVPSQEYERIQVPVSPASEQSMQVLSCSIPMRGLNKAGATNDMPLYPHPVPHPVPPRFAASPQHATSIKRPNRRSHSHKRSGSFSDALRDHRTPLSNSKTFLSDADISIISKIPGSLVRGALFQPGTPYIDVKSSGLRHVRSNLDLEPANASGTDVHIRPGHATNPGMKKILGSVRRALSSKQPSASAPQLPGTSHQQRAAPPTRSSNPTTISTVSVGVHKRRHGRPRPQVRIDKLASQVSESFTRAVRADLKFQHQHQHQKDTPDLAGFEFDFDKQRKIGGGEQGKTSSVHDLRIDSNITTGSKSIVIMDDTGAPELPMMTGALPTPPTAGEISKFGLLALHQRGFSIDERLAEADAATTTRHSDLYEDLVPYTEQEQEHDQGPVPVPQPVRKPEQEQDPSHDWQRLSRGSTERPTASRRRSLSEGREQMHSFRRRGSTKTSIARSSSLRRHASYNSGLRRQHADSIAPSLQTMSSNNDPFFLDQDSKTPAAGPARQLRRRPGGDLRAAGNVQDLEHVQRPHSTGSISNRTHSIANSVILRSDRFADPMSDLVNRREPGNERESLARKSISLVDTHSSQPNLRPSFEAEVAKLAALPDDIDDDGGIESALMKLEGRFEKRSPEPSPTPRSQQFDVYRPTGAPAPASDSSSAASHHDDSLVETPRRRDDTLHQPLARPELEEHHEHRFSGEGPQGRTLNIHSTVGSEDSYSSIPLLDRGLSDIAASPASRTLESMRWSAKPAPLKSIGAFTGHQGQITPKMTSANSSIELIIETDSMKMIPRNGTFPQETLPRESFLLDDDQDLSDLGDDDSGIGTRSDGTSHGVRSFFDDEPATIEMEKDTMPTHPMRHPPTPPLTGNRLTEARPRVDTTVFDRGLPTPGMTPTSRLNNQAFEQPGQAGQPLEHGIELQDLGRGKTPPPAHLPFVLAYDSETLAQQFTIVEKDALDEIDWRELIELRWKQSSPQIRDWVEYLRTQDARGVDVVIARFNIVVKWAISECLLTEATEERARCIVKYIHIASHARRLRNYATMYQITIALLSADVSRLKSTWALIPAAELQTMRELEALVQPLRNFHNLRVEMETASVEDGCIPFIGIYTRDLIYNAQKPAFIDAPPVDGERLVNFERHHTAAMIVKSLLRLLEASSKYAFKPEPTIISKCLWMAALGDEELGALSRKYE